MTDDGPLGMDTQIHRHSHTDIHPYGSSSMTRSASAACALPSSVWRRRGRASVTPASPPAVRPLVVLMIRPERHSMIEVTTPEPTVRPPSRMAKRSFSSMAIGTISSIVMAMLSPGITISVPSGRCTTPVTSVVRK